MNRLRPIDVADVRCSTCDGRVFDDDHLIDPDVVDMAVHNARLGASFMCNACCARLWITLAETAAEARRGLH